MKQHIAEFVKQFDKPLVSPIWGGKKDFPFLCLTRMEMARALGFETYMITPVLEAVKVGQLETEEQLEKLINERKIDESYIEQEIQTLKRLKEEKAGLMIGGGCFGPLTIVSDILGAERTLKMILRNPSFVERCVAYVTDFIIELAEREKEEGQDFFWIAEPLASLIAPEKFWRFSGKYLKLIYEKADAPGFLHVCGKTLKQTPYMVETGAEVLSIDYCTDIGECIRIVDENVVIMGNVNPTTLRFGTREEVREEIQQIFDACKGHTNFILSTGCSIMEGTPDENIMVMFEMCEG